MGTQSVTNKPKFHIIPLKLVFDVNGKPKNLKRKGLFKGHNSESAKVKHAQFNKYLYLLVYYQILINVFRSNIQVIIKTAQL